MSSGIPPIPLRALLSAQWVDDCSEGAEKVLTQVYSWMPKDINYFH